MNILNTQPVPDKIIADIEKLGYTFYDYKKTRVDEALALNIDILFGHEPFRFLPISNYPNLKMVQLGSAGINHMPLEEIESRGILLCNNRGTFSIPIAEFVVMRILEILKYSRALDNLQSEKQWQKLMSIRELSNHTVGFIGTGSIAIEAAKRLTPFGCEIVGYSKSGKLREFFHSVYTMESANNNIGNCDFIVITAPYTKETHHLVDSDLLNSMKEGASIINIARGSIIDELALIESLQKNHIAFAALDVFELEPLPETSPLWNMENVLISSHTSFVSPINEQRTMATLVENLKRFKSGKELINLVDTTKGY